MAPVDDNPDQITITFDPDSGWDITTFAVTFLYRSESLDPTLIAWDGNGTSPLICSVKRKIVDRFHVVVTLRNVDPRRQCVLAFDSPDKKGKPQDFGFYPYKLSPDSPDKAILPQDFGSHSYKLSPEISPMDAKVKKLVMEGSRVDVTEGKKTTIKLDGTATIVVKMNRPAEEDYPVKFLFTKFKEIGSHITIKQLAPPTTEKVLLIPKGNDSAKFQLTVDSTTPLGKDKFISVEIKTKEADLDTSFKLTVESK